MQARVGCSGWVYPHWRGSFYPADLRQVGWFAYYASRFDCCEINGSFYRLPSEKAVAAWAAAAPGGFQFAWKASRYITHNKKLLDARDSLDLVFGRMAPLGEASGPALFQLPPTLKRDDARLAAFLGWLPRGHRVTVEFRHPSWYAPPVMALLAAHDVALCVSDHHDAPAPWETTADWVYWRGHGPGGRYVGRYSEARLRRVADFLTDGARTRSPLYAFFDNDIGTAAPKDALRLRGLLADR